jgi:hypothetical protein
VVTPLPEVGRRAQALCGTESSAFGPIERRDFFRGDPFSDARQGGKMTSGFP